MTVADLREDPTAHPPVRYAIPLRAEELERMAPDADLAYLLEQGVLADTDDAALVEVVAAWQRMASWAAANAARAAAVLADRPSMNPEWPVTAGAVAEPNVAGEELAMRLGCSRRTARTLVDHGRAFEGSLMWTGTALARGDIDATKARVLVDALRDVPTELALDVQDAVLPGARGWTPTQLARQVTKALLVADPGGARSRHEVAARGRRVDRPRALPDGMAGVWAVLDAVDAVHLDNGLDTVARAARDAGDPRTLDQLRADVLVEIALGGEPHGLGPTVPSHPAQGHPAEGNRGVTRPDAVGAVSSTPRPRLPTRAEIRVTVPLGTLLGTNEEPGDVAGFGPISADAARALALGGPWRRVVTDPHSGAVLDVGRRRYRPPAALADHVRVRDGTCVQPSCSADAASCDLDHTVEFHRDGGSTSHASLAPLCRRDHRVKTDGAFRLEQPSPGRFRWVTPTGHVYEVQPGVDGVVTHRVPRDAPPPF